MPINIGATSDACNLWTANHWELVFSICLCALPARCGKRRHHLDGHCYGRAAFAHIGQFPFNHNCPTLRDAFNSAASGDTIQFAPAIDGQTITLTLFSNAMTDTEFGPSAFFLTGSETLTIDGLTGVTQGITIARSTAAGTSAFRLFDVDTGSTLSLQDVTLRNGLAQAGTGSGGGGGIGDWIVGFHAAPMERGHVIHAMQVDEILTNVAM
jgi:hypothetical protein